MDSRPEHTDFSKKTFEDFLQDDFFLSSMRHPTPETEAFWNAFEQSHPADREEYRAAKECVKAFASHTDCLSDGEMAGMWEQIADATAESAANSAIYNKVENRKARRSFWIGISVAASVVLLLGSFFFLKNYQAWQTPDIAAFAIETKATMPSTEDALLILSEEKVVSLKEKESEVTYDSVEIKANRENISKEKTAEYNQLVIPRGKRSVLTFSDGSKVWVNAGTRVVYPAEFEKDKREIYVDGEIYIEVARDEKRPFYVRTKDMNVRVLGTKFNVTAYESESLRHVVLAQGCVQVETAGTPKTILAPSQMFTSGSGKDRVEEVDVEKYISWIHGLYCFESADLGLVLKRLSTYYGINVEFDSALSEIKCSGKIDLKDNFETVLNGLSFVTPLSYAYNEETMTYRIEKK